MSSIRTRRTAPAVTTPATPSDPVARRRWLALTVLAVAQFMVFLDGTRRSWKQQMPRWARLQDRL